MLRDKALTPGMSCWDMRGAGSRRPRQEGGGGREGERSGRGMGGTKKHGAPSTHENQMKGRLDDSLGPNERKRARRKGLVKPSESAGISIGAQCAPHA